jgi:PhnB protein
MQANAKPIPDGYHSLTPNLTYRNAPAAIEWLKKVFDATAAICMPDPQGRIVHAELRIGNSMLMLHEETPDWGQLSPQALNGSSGSTFVYLEDVDATYAKAIAAGAKSTCPPSDMFWGDRMAKVIDPFGHVWGLATHKVDMTPEQMAKGAEDFFKQMCDAPKP